MDRWGYWGLHIVGVIFLWLCHRALVSGAIIFAESNLTVEGCFSWQSFSDLCTFLELLMSKIHQCTHFWARKLVGYCYSHHKHILQGLVSRWCYTPVLGNIIYCTSYVLHVYVCQLFKKLTCAVWSREDPGIYLPFVSLYWLIGGHILILL